MKTLQSGLRAWLIQRISAVFMLLFLLYALAIWTTNRPGDYEAWRAWILGGTMRVPMTLFFTAMLLHVWVGLRDVIMDYVHPAALRVGALSVAGLGLMALAAWTLQILVAA